jgi:plasmid stabilization system protein ParE
MASVPPMQWLHALSAVPSDSFPDCRSPAARDASQKRELVISGTPYVRSYRIAGDAIHILRVFHGARRWPAEH